MTNSKGWSIQSLSFDNDGKIYSISVSVEGERLYRVSARTIDRVPRASRIPGAPPESWLERSDLNALLDAWQATVEMNLNMPRPT